jgi:hypothetical protein
VLLVVSGGDASVGRLLGALAGVAVGELVGTRLDCTSVGTVLGRRDVGALVGTLLGASDGGASVGTVLGPVGGPIVGASVGTRRVALVGTMLGALEVGCGASVGTVYGTGGVGRPDTGVVARGARRGAMIDTLD